MHDASAPLERLDSHTPLLMAQHPPRWHNRNKALAFAMACPPGCAHRGRVGYTRWAAMDLPGTCDFAAAPCLLQGRPDVYDYVPAHADAVAWHVNFADPYLFVAYSGSLLAQDEMQVLEHPALGALKEALDAGGHEALTRTMDGAPTPVLVTGVERRCRIDTAPNAEEGRSQGLYGNRFAAADKETVARAVSAIDPPTLTNLIAIAAPACGYGSYDADTIRDVLVTAYTGFRAAKRESVRVAGPDAPAEIHTGFWGCGAFGGNRTLMTALQLMAACMANVDHLVFHTFDEDGLIDLDQGRLLVAEEFGAPAATEDVIRRLEDLRFEWGVSDGN